MQKQVRNQDEPKLLCKVAEHCRKKFKNKCFFLLSPEKSTQNLYISKKDFLYQSIQNLYIKQENTANWIQSTTKKWYF